MFPSSKPVSPMMSPPRSLGASAHSSAVPQSIASSMPSAITSADYVPRALTPVGKVESFNINDPRMQIYHPDLAPSAQSTEANLLARSMMQQSYAQNAAATRLAQTSNAMRDAPRFSRTLDIMA